MNKKESLEYQIHIAKKLLEKEKTKRTIIMSLFFIILTAVFIFLFDNPTDILEVLGCIGASVLVGLFISYLFVCLWGLSTTIFTQIQHLEDEINTLEKEYYKSGFDKSSYDEYPFDDIHHI